MAFARTTRARLLSVAAAALLAAPLAAAATTEQGGNPCEQASWRGLLCPDLVMKRPKQLAIETLYGRKLLRTGSSIDSVGEGPMAIVGEKYAPLLMHVRQRITKQGGGAILVKTPAVLRFKQIPGQGGYWKLRDAARMELWSLDADGLQRRLVRTSPKQHYCLRDLERTRGELPGSPAARVFPACNQDPAITRVRLGTSVGWSDIYPAPYYEQWIDVTGLRGRFALVHIADPEDVLYESNETNNASRSFVQLPEGKLVR